MSQNTKSNNGLCEPCGLRPFERNRYFDGKLLTTRDFQDEQDYLRGKDKLHNSLLHGYGTVCGLKVAEHPIRACQHRYVVLEPGLALDCCGREIIVAEETKVDLLAKIEEALRDKGMEPEDGLEVPYVFVRLAYRQCDTDPVPALLDDCGCSQTDTEFSRTRETYRLFVDLGEPLTEAAEPLDARLDWQHTLSLAHPEAVVFDRALMRLYVAEYDGSEGHLRLYDANNHSQITRVPARAGLRHARRPTALARSNLGDLIYVAIDHGETVEPYIAIFEQDKLETDPGEADVALLSVPDWTEVPGLPRIIRLDVSGLDDSLFALIDDGRILRWSSNEIRAYIDGDGAIEEPVAITQYLHNATSDPAAATVRPTDMTLSFEGRWLVVADGTEEQLIVVHLAEFSTPVDFGAAAPELMQAHRLPPGDIPWRAKFSYDGGFLYVLCQHSQMLYRIERREFLSDFIPDIPDEAGAFSAVRLADPSENHPPTPMDVVASPRDNWLYVLRGLLDGEGNPRDRGEVLILSVDAIDKRRGPDTYDLDPEINRGSVNTEGNALFQNLAKLGQRLYVAGETLPEDPEDTPTQGSISILFIDEAACDTFIYRTVEGCPECIDPTEGVIIASIQDYRWNENLVEDVSAGNNRIDNMTHRQMAPSTNTLRQVIECMLAKGFSEGVPGPRGPVGPRGPGIIEATATALDAGEDPTADVEPAPGGVEGDQRLVLGIPRGQDGDPGPRGPGITEASVTTRDPGTGATASLESIVGDPEGDQRLVLGIPRGANIVDVVLDTPDTGTADADLDPIDPLNPEGDQRLTLIIPIPTPEPPEPEDFNRVINASWHHDEVLTLGAFMDRVNPLVDGEPINLGLVVQFESEVLVETLHERSVFVLARRLDETGLECECVLPMKVEPVAAADTTLQVVCMLVGDTQRLREFELVNEVKIETDSFDAVRLVPAEDSSWDKILSQIDEFNIRRLTVVLRGDWILDQNKAALDGNHIWPGVPELPSGNGTQGNDWISVIHFVDQFPDDSPCLEHFPPS